MLFSPVGGIIPIVKRSVYAVGISVDIKRSVVSIIRQFSLDLCAVGFRFVGS
jgi:hypothetical protein